MATDDGAIDLGAQRTVVSTHEGEVVPLNAGQHNYRTGDGQGMDGLL